ncbi:hypothetical protein X735_22425 [Mesorhizobium sp. L2C085B000]|nr:hypothetical protein X735_22425 [Mesorhizobium sp. L2C085B000]
MLFVSARTGIVSSEEAVAAEAVEHLAQIRCTCKNVVARLIRIVTEAVLGAQFFPCRRHDLHQTHCAFARHRMNIPNALDAHDGAK